MPTLSADLKLPRMIGWRRAVLLSAHFLGSVWLCAQTAPPQVFTDAPAPIIGNSATLRGVAVPGAEPAVAWFEWSSGDALDRVTPAEAIGDGPSLVPVRHAVAGLQPGSFYQCRLVVSNAAGVVTGATRRFTTGRRVTGWGSNLEGQTASPMDLTNAVAIAAGANHNLAVRADGTVRAWGEGLRGKTAVPLDLTNAIAVAGGTDHSAALRSDGTVIAWGAGFYGETSVPTGLNQVMALAAGGYRCLALRADGTVVAWGAGVAGDTTVMPRLANIVAIATGPYHSLALRADGKVIAWGSNLYGKTNVPTGLTQVVALAAGTDYSLALQRDGTVVGWGANSSGQLTPPDGLANVDALAAGDTHAVVARSDGVAQAWGSNQRGQSTVPTGLGSVVSVAAGRFHSLALGNLRPVVPPLEFAGPANHDLLVTLQAVEPDADPVGFRVTQLPGLGRLYQHADGVRGAEVGSPQTMVSDPAGRLIFAPDPDGFGRPYTGFAVVANDGFSDSSAATIALHTLADPKAHTQSPGPIRPLTAVLNGMAVAGGLDSVAWFEWGVRGGAMTPTLALGCGNGIGPQRVSFPLDGLGAGGTYQCRLVVSNRAGVARGGWQIFTTGRSATAWGANNLGQTNLPTALDDLVAISAARNLCLGLRSSGTVVAWGDGTQGQTNVPASLTNVIAIAAGDNHALALRANGTVAAWGNNAFGQTDVPADLTNVIAIAPGLALKTDGTVVSWGLLSDVPAPLSNVVALASGLALKADGTVFAWGGSSSLETNVPADLTNVVAVATGGTHRLALRANGTVAAWGNSLQGQTNVPAGLSNVVAIAGGGYHNLALCADGAVVAWRANGYGQTNVPANLSPAAAVAAGGDHSLVIGNVPPQATPQTVSAPANQDVVIALGSVDPNHGAATFRVTALPMPGRLCQCVNGLRGPAISAAGTTVTDPAGRVVFVPEVDEWGSPYTSFAFLVNDGEADSEPATVTVRLTVSTCVHTQAAVPAASTSASLNGMLVPGELPGLAWFEWGPRGTFNATTAPQPVGRGSALQTVSALVHDLDPDRAYQCRLVASNAAGVAYGSGRMFATGLKATAWGGNTQAQTNVPPGLGRVVAVAAGEAHSLAVRTDGTVAAWGQGLFGQLTVPPGLNQVVAIDAGWGHSVALKADGAVIAWGWNAAGQTDVPTNLRHAVAVAAGDHHNLALHPDGTVTAWGSLPLVPAGLSNVVAVAAGAQHSAAVRADGRVVTWSDTIPALIAAPPGLSNVVAIAAGAQHDLALKADGRVVAWGSNASGQTNVPTSLSNVVAVAAGGNRSYALKADGMIVSWPTQVRNPPPGLSNVVLLAAGASHALAIGGNLAPQAAGSSASGPADQDLVVTLNGSDPNGDPLVFRITGLPATGGLFQWANGQRQALIAAPQTVVADPGGRVVFVPEPGSQGTNATSLRFTAGDGQVDSAPATVSIRIDPAPLRVSAYGWDPQGGFTLRFPGYDAGSYSVWASTNLVQWDLLGPATARAPGWWEFIDPASSEFSVRFYRLGAP